MAAQATEISRCRHRRTVLGLSLATTGFTLDRTWTTDADFNAGTTVGMDVVGDALQLSLDGVGTPDSTIPWWDDAWGLVFAFDPTSIELPATGATATHGALRLGGASFAVGLLLLAGARRRRPLPA